MNFINERQCAAPIKLASREKWEGWASSENTLHSYFHIQIDSLDSIARIYSTVHRANPIILSPIATWEKSRQKVGTDCKGRLARISLTTVFKCNMHVLNATIERRAVYKLNHNMWMRPSFAPVIVSCWNIYDNEIVSSIWISLERDAVTHFARAQSWRSPRA